MAGWKPPCRGRQHQAMSLPAHINAGFGSTAPGLAPHGIGHAPGRGHGKHPWQGWHETVEGAHGVPK